MRSSTAHNRRFAYAVAVSVALHLVALSGAWPAFREALQEPVTPPSLVTRIVELAPPSPPERKPPPRPETKRAETPAPLPQPDPAPVAEPAPAPMPAEPPPAASAPAGPAQIDSRAAEAATAAQYRMQLIAYAQRNKPPYPAIARENNWAGDVVLEIVLRSDGRGELGLRRASGYAVLDKLALDTYQQALRAVPVPPALQGRQVRLEPLRVVYNLTQ